MHDVQNYLDIIKVVKEGFSAGREVVAFGKDITPALRKGVRLINEHLYHQRERAVAETLSKVPPILERRSVRESVDPSPKFLIPWFEAASNDTATELRDMWAQLLAAAMDPNRSSKVRMSFIETVKNFDPLDALVLKVRYDQSGNLSPNPLEYIAHALTRSRNEIELSVRNLEKLGCVSYLGRDETQLPQFYIVTYGRELIGVCAD